MPERELPARPNIEQYKKQAKDLAKDCALGVAGALERVHNHHPRFSQSAEESRAPVSASSIM